MDSLLTPTLRLVRGAAIAFCLSILAVVLLCAAAEARPVSSSAKATVFGAIDSSAAVKYYFSGSVSAANLTFRCMTKRRVDLFRVGPKGGREKVASTKTNFLGEFLGAIERPLSAIPGHYFVKVEPRVTRARGERLRCLATRSPAFLVEVPSGLSP